MDLKGLLKKNDSKIVFLVADGLGGIPHPEFGYKTELEYASTPNLDDLAGKSILGLTIPVDHGITPGSGPAHLSLFGYNPMEHEIGRGALEAYGVGFMMTDKDIAARANFGTSDRNGVLTDRRAGRIPTEGSRKIVERIGEKIRKIEDVEIILKPGKEHRFVLILRGEGLSDRLTDTDPQKEGLKPLEPQALSPEAEKTVRIVKEFLKRAQEVIKDEPKANTILLRGFSRKPEIEPFEEKFGLKPLALANYPMYKGLTRILGMETPDLGDNFEDLIKYYKEHFAEYDYFYIHYKYTDKAGEDGDFLKKARYIEELDALIPEILSTNPDVFVVTADHSTPSYWKQHSWHPNPTLVYSKYAGADDRNKFTEKECKYGYLGLIYAYHLMPITLANAGRLKKYGA